MAEESKPVDPTKEDPKVAAVDSEDDEVEETAGQPSTSDPAKKKKKKSKTKKLKEVFGGKSSDPEADVRKAIASLPKEQLDEFIKLNPALAGELSTAKAGSSSGETTDAVEALKRLRLQDIMTGLASSGKNVKDMSSYKFWQTQPVPKFDETSENKIVEERPIKVQTVDEVPKDPPKMIEGFEWVTMDLTDPDQLKEVYDLLNGHYVEDDEAMFRFKYSPSMMKW